MLTPVGLTLSQTRVHKMAFRNVLAVIFALACISMIIYALDERYTLLLNISAVHYIWWSDPVTRAGNVRNLPTRIYRLYKHNSTNCSALFLNVSSEKLKSDAYHKTHSKIPHNNTFYIDAAKNCTRFREERSYIMTSLTEKEEEFPIAYSIMLYKG